MRNKTALIAGASGGIGYEFVKLLTKDCSILVLVAQSLDRLIEVKKELDHPRHDKQNCGIQCKVNS